MEPNICQLSWQEAIFAEGDKLLLAEPLEPNICRRSCQRSRICQWSQLFAEGAQIFADEAKYLPTELPQKPNLPTEPTILRRSQLFAHGAAAKAKFELLTEPIICRRSQTELTRSQICQRSQIIPDGAAWAKYLSKELPQKLNLPTEPTFCQQSQLRSQLFANGAAAKAKFAEGAKYLPTEPNICRRSRRSQICHFRVLHVLLFVYFLMIFALLPFPADNLFLI
jgi:hypothetical protein